jgi:hypothetical protein
MNYGLDYRACYVPTDCRMPRTGVMELSYRGLIWGYVAVIITFSMLVNTIAEERSATYDGPILRVLHGSIFWDG